MPEALARAMEANADAYRRAVQSSAAGMCWDVLVLTATNEKQAQGYRQELELRQRSVGPTQAFFPAIQKTLVIADPPGGRIGSGGATLSVLRELRKSLGDLRKPRILLVHSGGMSQRLPVYSALGKIFAPLPLLRPDGQTSTLFDHLYVTLAGLPARMGPGMLIVAGDVFLLFDHRQANAPRAEATALTMRVDAAMGKMHGVFVAGAHDKVARTLQKPSMREMNSSGAVDSRGKVLIDTGLLFFDSRGVDQLARMPALHEKYNAPLDLYDDMAKAMVGTEVCETDGLGWSTVHPSPLKWRWRKKRPSPTRGEGEMQRELRCLLRGTNFGVMEMRGEFLHLGTTRQFRDAMTGRDKSPAAQLFQQNLQVRSRWTPVQAARVYNSILRKRDGEKSGQLGRGSVVEHSTLVGNTRIGRGCFVSQVQAKEAIDLADNRLLFSVPVRDQRGTKTNVHLLCGVEDDFKGRFSDGKCGFLNAPIARWMKARKVKAEEIWAGVEKQRRTLWNAQLFVAWSQNGLAEAIETIEHGRDIKSWRRRKRHSMAMLLEHADTAAMTADRQAMSARLQTGAYLESIRDGQDLAADSFLSNYATGEAYAAAMDLLSDFVATSNGDAGAALRAARALWCCAELCQRPDRPPFGVVGDARAFVERAFAKVALASEIGHQRIRLGNARSAARSVVAGVRVCATSPVRLDLAGGWSDTPPYCFERGGQVVNVAIDLDGQPPVRAMVETLEDRTIRLESCDLGQCVELNVTAQEREPIRLDDPFALHKVALAIVGLDRAGLHISTECRVPKGSGLGTSSILGATLLAALHGVKSDRALNPSMLIEQTQLLEQRLSTGGGWQDQVGGIIGGIKFTHSAPGVPQKLRIERLKLSNARLEAFERRLVVYYTGQQRLARDILRRVMGRWLAREPAMVALMEQLKASAGALRVAIGKSDMAGIAREIARYWQIKKELYLGSTTPAVDELFLKMRTHYLACGLAGAGGGGFAYFFCASERQAGRLKHELAHYAARPGAMGAVYDARISRTGLIVQRQAKEIMADT